MYRVLSAPLNLQLEVTGRCNINCKHCYNFWRGGCEDEYHSGDMTQDTANRLFDEILKNDVKQITITGGEPLLNLDVVTLLLKRARKHGVTVSMNSNLICMNDEIAKELRELGLRGALTSFMGSSPESYESVSGVPGSFERAVKGIKCALRNGFVVACNMVTTYLNVHDIFNTASLLKEIGVKKFAMTPACCPSSCSDFSQFSLSKESIIKAYNELLRVKSELGMQIDTLVPVPFCLMPYLSDPSHVFRRRCSAGVSYGMVSSGGIIRPCPNSSTEYGSVLDEGLKTTWSKMTSWRSGERIPKDCKECKLFARCGGGCRYRAEYSSKKQDGLDPLVEIEQVDNAIDILKKNKKPSQMIREIPKDAFLSFKGIVFRKEDFGAVISRGNNWLYVNEDGLCLIKHGIEKGIVSTNDSLIFKNQKFILNLLNRKIISLES